MVLFYDDGFGPHMVLCWSIAALYRVRLLGKVMARLYTKELERGQV